MPPFRRELLDGILILTLDTPGGAVNVFNRDAAACLRDILREVSAASTRAVVLRSGKPRSFLNGVGLLMAGTAKSADEAVEMARPIRAAYEALRDCPVPTVAAIHGNCYGCGVELVLQCRYRIAADTIDTRFVMTEIADYLFIPMFGGTQNLPGVLGLEAAADFVLWSKTISATEAVDVGLVDRCFHAESFQLDVDRFVRQVTGDCAPPPRERRPTPEAERLRIRGMNADRIRKLPPAYRPLYSTCFDLLDRAASKGAVDESDFLAEARESGRSILGAPCRGAWPFFFVRQTARALSVASGGGSSTRAIAFESDEPLLQELASEMNRRCVRLASNGPGSAAKMTQADSTDGPIRRIQLSSYGAPLALEVGGIQACDWISGAPFDGRGVVLYAPLRSVGVDIVEVASRLPNASALEGPVSAVLSDAYFKLLRTRPRASFLIDELLAAWLRPQLAYIATGGAPGDLSSSLRTFGFTRLPGDWVGRLDFEALGDLVRRGLPPSADLSRLVGTLPRTSADDGRLDPTVTTAVLVSLGAFAARMLQGGSAPHPSIVDLAAREIIDFPLLHTSLCRYLTLDRARELLDSKTPFRRLIPAEDVASLDRFLAQNREHYVGGAFERK